MNHNAVQFTNHTLFYNILVELIVVGGFVVSTLVFVENIKYPTTATVIINKIF